MTYPSLTEYEHGYLNYEYDLAQASKRVDAHSEQAKQRIKEEARKANVALWCISIGLRDAVLLARQSH
jgi:hypothetical protein